MKRRIATLLVAVLALVAAACGGDEPAADAGPAETSADTAGDTATATAEPTDAPADTATEPVTGTEATGADDGATEASAAATVAIASTDLGEILVDGEGRTLYAFLNDEEGEATCYDDCAANWPPLEGPATAGDGVDSALLSTTERDDGTVQAVYGDWPLYYFAGDAAPGDVNGQGVGDVWFVVDATGEPIREAPASG